MSDTSLRNNFPYILPAQAQKYVPHNAAMEQIDSTMHLCLKAVNVTTPPENPIISDCYDLGAEPSGIFEGHANQIAAYCDTGWQFYPKVKGMTALDCTRNIFMGYDGVEWSQLSLINSAGEIPKLGINTVPDETNKLTVKSEAVLFTTDDLAETPTGDLRIACNKTASSDTASLLYQKGYSARAELGLIGNDNFSIKVSADGAVYKTGLEIDPATGNCGVGDYPSEALNVLKTAPGISRISVSNASEDEYAGTSINMNAANGHSTSLLQYNSGAAYFLSSSSSMYYQLTGTNPVHRFYLASQETLTIATDKVSIQAPAQLLSAAVSALPSASLSGAGAVIYVPDASGGAVLAFSDGTNWRRSTDRAVIT